MHQRLAHAAVGPDRCRPAPFIDWLLALGALLLTLLFALPAHAGDIVIEDARTRVDGGSLLLDASASFTFGRDALAALNSGIPLFIEFDVVVARRRRLMWDAEIAAIHRRYSIERHALTKKFLVTDAVTGERRAFPELEPAIAELGRIRDLVVADTTRFAGTGKYDAALRLRLDLEALPAPMIPLAYVSPGWHMSSGWHRWPLTL